jgi:RNA polymerase sigma factor for flagellar operon FliA
MIAVADPIDLTDQRCQDENLSIQDRERLILEHLPQVRRIARRVRRRLPANIALDDLVSSGILGLISAVDGFDPARRVTLAAYAERRIKGAILDSLRRLDWAPREQRKHAKQIAAAVAAAEQSLQRSPTEDEIATKLNLTIEHFRKWRTNIQGLTLLPLESAGSDYPKGHDLLRVVSDDPRRSPSALFERREVRHALADAVPGIPEAERTILGLHYSGGLSLAEISGILGLHRSRIAQLKVQAILRLRVSMAKYWPTAGSYPTLSRA